MCTLSGVWVLREISALAQSTRLAETAGFQRVLSERIARLSQALPATSGPENNLARRELNESASVMGRGRGELMHALEVIEPDQRPLTPVEMDRLLDRLFTAARQGDAAATASASHQYTVATSHLVSELRHDANLRADRLATGYAVFLVFEIGLIAALGLIVLPALGRTSEAVEMELHERKRVRYMMEMIQCISSRSELTMTLGTHLERILPDMVGSVHLFSPSRDAVEQVGSWGDIPANADDIPLADCWGLRLGKAYGSSDGRHVLCQHVPEGLHGHWCFPMLADGDAVGMFHVRATGEGVFTELQRERASQLAEGLAIALANMRLRESLRNQSIRDPLTGVFNRRYMEESLTRELRRAARREHPIAVMMIDLDHFKVLNDTFGHAVGDELLCAFGRFLSTWCRAEDIVCRYGGEEFVMIFPEMSAADAAVKAGFLRTEWAGHSVNNGSGGRVSALFSAGVATFPEDASSTDTLLSVADAALYLAKSRGRDRVVSVTDEPSLRRVTSPEPAQRPHRPQRSSRAPEPVPVALDRAS